MKYKKTMMAILIAIIVLILVLIAFLISYFVPTPSKEDEVSFTWEEFEAMTPEQQIEFQNGFKDDKDFEKWMEEAQKIEVVVPWEEGGKAPEEYSWEEFEDLTAEQQIIFQNSFKDPIELEKWMDDAQNKEPEISWEEAGKELLDYTWEEFEAMTPEQQMEFQNSFESPEAFEEWMIAANSADSENAFESKDDIFETTWEEFQAMSMEEQMIFQKSFGDIEEFEKWLNANEPK